MGSNQRALRYLTLISQFGINMLVPIFMCSFAGMYLDRKLGTNFFMILLFFVGALAGFRNIYRMSQRMLDADRKERKNKRDKRVLNERISDKSK